MNAADTSHNAAPRRDHGGPSLTTHYRQGDVLLVRVSSLPDGVKPKARDKGRIVIAYGEATGHAHAISAPWAKCFEALNGDTYVELAQEADLLHEEHATITVEPGVWRYVAQREYAPDAIRLVAD